MLKMLLYFRTMCQNRKLQNEKQMWSYDENAKKANESGKKDTINPDQDSILLR